MEGVGLSSTGRSLNEYEVAGIKIASVLAVKHHVIYREKRASSAIDAESSVHWGKFPRITKTALTEGTGKKGNVWKKNAAEETPPNRYRLQKPHARSWGGKRADEKKGDQGAGAHELPEQKKGGKKNLKQRLF